MHARIELGYETSDRISKLDAAARRELNAALPALEIPDDLPEGYRLPYDRHEHTIDLATTGETLIRYGLSFKIKRFTSCYKVDGPSRDGSTTNIQVAIPNLLLFAVDEVQLIEDACTDALQRELDDGWRILAVCPPPAQRRPDYILGRQRAAAR